MKLRAREAAALLRALSIESLRSEPCVSLELTNSRSSALLTCWANQGVAVSLTTPIPTLTPFHRTKALESELCPPSKCVPARCAHPYHRKQEGSLSQGGHAASAAAPPGSIVSEMWIQRQVTGLKLLPTLDWNNCYVKANTDESPVGSCLPAWVFTHLSAKSKIQMLNLTLRNIKWICDSPRRTRCP